MNQVAILITSFNRRDTTIRCLRKIHQLMKCIDVYLVDDASSDMTASAVAAEFPNVKIIRGSGSLFWNRGMYLAWDCAKNGNYSHYLWLNDDVILYEKSFVELMACSEQNKHSAIIAGIIESHDGKDVLYGGTNNVKDLLQPNGNMQDITNMNGNVVLVPAAVFSKVGNLDNYFHHDLGDVDYALRAKSHGFKVLTTRIAVGSCDRNNTCRVRLWNANLSDRFKKLYTPLGNHPKLNFYFRKKHYGLSNAFLYFLYIHIINILPDWLVKKIFGDRYIS